MPSLSKVKQRGASALVSTIDSVTYAVHYLGNKLAATPLSLSKSILPKTIIPTGSTTNASRCVRTPENEKI